MTTLHRFFVAPELIEGDQIFFPSDLAHQLGRVLRLREGDRVRVRLEPFGELPERVHRAAVAEAERLAAFLGGRLELDEG